MEKYIIVETQIKANGDVNVITTTRNSFASGASYYYERLSKMYMNTEFPRVAVSLIDAEQNVELHEVITTQYVES